MVGVTQTGEQLVGARVVVEHRGLVLEIEVPAHQGEHGLGIGDQRFVVNLEVAARSERGTVAATLLDAALPAQSGFGEAIRTERHLHHRRHDVPTVADDVHEAGVGERAGEQRHRAQVARRLVAVPRLAVSRGVGGVETGDNVGRRMDAVVVA